MSTDQVNMPAVPGYRTVPEIAYHGGNVYARTVHCDCGLEFELFPHPEVGHKESPGWERHAASMRGLFRLVPTDEQVTAPSMPAVLDGHAIICTVSFAPGDDGEAYTITLPNGQQGTLSRGQFDYSRLGRVIDRLFPLEVS